MMPASFWSLRRNDFGLRSQQVPVFQHLFGPTYAAANDDEVGCKQKLHMIQVLLYPYGPGIPSKAFPLSYASSGISFGFVAMQRKVSQLGVGHQRAVDKQAGSNAGAEGQHQDHTLHSASCAERHLGDACGISIVEDFDGTAGSL